MESQFLSVHDCPCKPKKCVYCEAIFPSNQYINHENTCGSRTELCQQCGEYIQKRYIKQHITENTCSRYKIINKEELKKQPINHRKSSNSEEVKKKSLDDRKNEKNDKKYNISPPPKEKSSGVDGIINKNKPKTFGPKLTTVPDSQKISSKIEPKIQKIEIIEDGQRYEEGDMNEIPIEILDRRIKTNSPIPSKKIHINDSKGSKNTESRNLLDDEERILRAVIEESKNDNIFAFDDDEEILNQVILQSMKEI